MIVVNRQQIIADVGEYRGRIYPEEDALIAALRERASQVVVVDALPLAEEAGNTRTVNTIMLAALSTLLETDAEVWETAILRRVPQRYADVNKVAFRLGRAAAT